MPHPGYLCSFKFRNYYEMGKLWTFLISFTPPQKGPIRRKYLTTFIVQSWFMVFSQHQRSIQIHVTDTLRQKKAGAIAKDVPTMHPTMTLKAALLSQPFISSAPVDPPVITSFILTTS